ncbi:hypothetical protein ACOME3_008582 [Neoechinorhynchus agilis]
MKRTRDSSKKRSSTPKQENTRKSNQSSLLNYFGISQTRSIDRTDMSLVNSIIEVGSSVWISALRSQFNRPYIRTLSEFLDNERLKKVVYPPADKVFTWLSACEFNKIKVVIIGQDPYHNAGQAHGLCFSVLPPCKPPPSLLNIFTELRRDLKIETPSHGNLIGWARQGVLLLNACLTVVENNPNSHKGKGWEIFTDYVITTIAERLDKVVFMLWGMDAQKKTSLIKSKDKHTILCSSHPSPLSARRGFLGCGHFSKANNALSAVGLDKIDWADLPKE